MIFRKIFSCAILLFSLTIAAVPASGQATGFGKGVGVRAGAGLNPDQVVGGIQADLGSIATLFRFTPSFDAGFGDDQTVYGFNGDFILPLYSPASSMLGFYVGGGPTISILDVDGAGSDTELGLSVIGGTRFAAGSRSAYTLEARFGVGDVPDFRLLFGILFGARTEVGE